ncbi:unnamed protein product [Menidia menidia]|uniref:(Atlantic silverside) hypothetical protein n=1 Tax=Menidia menidia TaxID=238744 RepID=A0A8S4BG52_9TELE|nr:unnamed protein product [Menidia menidia]
MDQVRFQEMQQEAEQLVLLSSVLLIVFPSAGEPVSGLMDNLKLTVAVMLADLQTHCLTSSGRRIQSFRSLEPKSRVQSYLLAALECSQHRTPPSLPGGLEPISRELKELAVRFSRLVNFNKLVYSPFYQKILQKVLAQGEET